MKDGQGKTRIGRIIAKACADAAFKARLVADPVATLKGEGIAVPEGVAVTVLEDTPALVHVVLPPLPPDGEIGEAQLAALAGGSHGTPGTGVMFGPYLDGAISAPGTRS